MDKNNRGEPEHIADYINLYKKLTTSNIKRSNEEEGKFIKIAILSSFTISGIKETLFVKCSRLNIIPEFYQSNYNQYIQEILNNDSRLYKFKPDLIIIFIDTRSILGDYFFLPYQISNKQRKDWQNKKLEELTALVQKIKNKSSAKILLHNFEIPLYSPLGINENKQEFGIIESIETLNAGLRRDFKNDHQTFIFDYEAFCAKIGKQHILDYKMCYLGDIKLNLQYIPSLCDEYLSYIKPLLSLSKKCIVLDLDNTLWGGIIGEDGIDKIKLGHNVEGRPFLEFQKYLLALFNRGVILAINSKNNLKDAMMVFHRHPYMILKENHFAAIKINWDDKIANMKAIAKELNIGTDSLVFIDDDKFNRQIMKNAMPEVLTVELPDDPSLYPKTLMELNDFNTLQITNEDINKSRMYAEQRKRHDFKTETGNINAYLKNLEMVATFEKANSFTIPRISQLTQKTNQFNTTTKIYLEEDIKRFSESRGFIIASVKAKDKFGDNGIIGVTILKKVSGYAWEIDTFLLSCRVIGRGIERAMLEYIIRQAKKRNAKIITGVFIPTKKNMPAKDFYKFNGFDLIKREGNSEIWQYNTRRKYKKPDFIKVIEG